MSSLYFLSGYCLGCVSMALLIKYKQKKALKLMQAQISGKKTNRVPVDVDFEDVDSNV